MRRRSCAFHAESQEGYIKIAMENQGVENYFYNQNSSTNPAAKRQKQMLRSSSQSSFIENTAYSHPIFDFSHNSEQVATTDSEDDSPFVYAADIMRSSIENQIPFDIQEKKLDCMLVGCPSIGKHALINSQFPDISNLDSCPFGNRLDLVIRKQRNGKIETTYQFWIKELIDNTYERLLELYYKKCSMFVFVYDVTSRYSFEKIQEEIEKIKTYVGSKFNGILIAANSHQQELRAVSYDEGVGLKLKYNLRHFSENNPLLENETHQLLRELDYIVEGY